MLLADVLSIALSILWFLAFLQGLWLVCRALWPARVARAADLCERAPVRCFFIGLLTTAAVVLAVVVVGRALGTIGQLAAFAIAFAYVVYLNIGVSGFVTLIGRRLASPSDLERPWRATVRGGVALELAALLPIVLPITFLLGAGAATLSFFDKRRAPAEMPASALPPRANWEATPPAPHRQPARAPAEVVA